MNMRKNHKSRGRGFLVALLALAVAWAPSGCDGILDVENPNQLIQDDLEQPEASRALANGVMATVARAYARIILRHDSASDELTFVGSRDAWLQLQRGDLRDTRNEFLDAGGDGLWDWVTEARWMGDEAIGLMRGFEDEGTLPSPVFLARAQLFSATIYTLIADSFEDFVFSDRMEAQPPIGPANMIGLYDTAIERLTGAIDRARVAGDTELETQAMAQRARTRHARAVWQMLNPPGSVPADPLVFDQAMVDDAEAALTLAESENWRFLFTYSAGTVSNNWGGWVNERLEHRVSSEYVIPTEDDKRVAEIRLEDPIDGIPDPALTARIMEVSGEGSRAFAPVTVTGAREMRLLLAEAALAQNDLDGFATQINIVRGLDGLTPWDETLADAGEHPSALDMLKHARRVNLFNQGRRLNDHYRFGDPNPQWDTALDAFTRPGTKFPITITEIRANPHIN